MNVSIGDYITLVRENTVVSGVCTSWHVIEGELYSLRIEHVIEPFVLGTWKIAEEEIEDE